MERDGSSVWTPDGEEMWTVENWELGKALKFWMWDGMVRDRAYEEFARWVDPEGEEVVALPRRDMGECVSQEPYPESEEEGEE